MSDMTASRLRLDPSTNLPSIHSFGELSNFLRSAVADEESLQMGDSMGTLASHIEAIVAGLKTRRSRESLAPQLMDLMTILREHRALVIRLSPAWRGLYEYASYLSALNNFRVLIGQWLLDKAHDEQAVGIENFELIAWRTLGEGMLLIDMYDQWRQQEAGESAIGTLEDPRVERARNWWDRLRR
jgi:hypothetical protein